MEVAERLHRKEICMVSEGVSKPLLTYHALQQALCCEQQVLGEISLRRCVIDLLTLLYFDVPLSFWCLV